MSRIIKAKVKNYKKDFILFNANDPIIENNIYFIKNGKALIKYKLNNNKTFVIKAKNGDFIGIFECLNNNNYRITEVIFTEDSKVCYWTKEEFLETASIVPELGLKSIGYLSAFLRTLNLKLQEIG